MSDRPPRPRLALAIPTYRRAAILAANIERVLDAARALGVAIYVSDDSPDDETELAVREIAARFPDLHYRRNTPALGHDANLVATLLWPDADYVWLLGDALWVRPDPLPRLVAFLGDQDMVCVNSHSPDDRMIPSAEGAAALALLREALWHQTLTGATVYGRRVRDWVAEQGDALVVKRNFPQLSMILGYASARPARIGWFGEKSLGSVARQSYWRDRAIDVFVEDWAALVNAFPAVIPPERRTAAIRSHSARMYLFDAPLLLELRAKGRFGWKDLRRPHFLDAMHLARWKVWALLGLPMPLVRLLRRLKAGGRRETG